MNGRHIALQRTVGFYCNKSAFCTKASALCVNNLSVVVVDFRNNHWYIRCAAMCTVVGNYRAFRFCVCFFQCANFIFFHVNCTEYKIYLSGNFVNVSSCVIYNHVFHSSRHWCFHSPAASNGIFVTFSGRACACRYCCYGKPWMVFQ